MFQELEKYLIKRRADLDVETPDDTALWNSIRGELDKKLNTGINHNRKKKLIMIRNLAAAAIILFSLGYIANDIINGRNSSREMTLSSINNSLGQQENDYKILVRLKTEEVKAYKSMDDDEIRELFDEIGKLDGIYNQSMKDLRELGPDPRIINTIFDTYEQKIRLLGLIILEINKTDSHENNEKNLY